MLIQLRWEVSGAVVLKEALCRIVRRIDPCRVAWRLLFLLWAFWLWLHWRRRLNIIIAEARAPERSRLVLSGALLWVRSQRARRAPTTALSPTMGEVPSL